MKGTEKGTEFGGRRTPKDMARQSNGPWYREAKNAWYVKVDGKQINLKVKGKSNRREAVKAWHNLMATGEPRQDAPLPPIPTPTPSPPTDADVKVKDVTAAFLADAGTRCKHESMAVYKSALNRLAKRFGYRSASTMKAFEVEAFANREDWSASTRNTFLSAIVTAFRWAVRAGMLTANPIAGLRKPPCGSRGASAVITQEQFDKLSEAANPAFKVFLNGLWLTGCRPGELARLTAEDVNADAGLAILNEHKTSGKTGRPRLIFLPAEAVKLCRELIVKNPTGPLFRNSWGNAWNRFTMQKAMEAARTKAKIPNAICYAMRHSFATSALAKGVPDATVAALLGHSGTTMLHRHYSHLTSQATVLRDAVNSVR